MDKKDLLKTAHLARLYLPEHEQGPLAEDLKNILDHFHKISSVPTSGLKPLVHPLEGMDSSPLASSDQVENGKNTEELLKLTEELVGSEYKVPVVV